MHNCNNQKLGLSWGSTRLRKLVRQKWGWVSIWRPKGAKLVLVDVYTTFHKRIHFFLWVIINNWEIRNWHAWVSLSSIYLELGFVRVVFIFKYPSNSSSICSSKCSFGFLTNSLSYYSYIVHINVQEVHPY